MSEIDWKLEKSEDIYIELGKRTYAPACLSMTCPNCGWVLDRDFSSDYFSYPTIGEPYTVTLDCEEGPNGEEGCGESFSVNLVLDLSVRFASDEEDGEPE